ncbi:MAG: lysophospholipase L1-like esterase [Paenibacillus sp.]|nr:lysophospholipase L1-like esterase [Paenibacillus sp.]
MNGVRWIGKTWGTLGDSITQANGYQPYVKEALKFEAVYNYGRGGCSMTAGGDRDEGATVNIAKTVEPTLDCITIFAGTNDYRLHMPLGEPGHSDPFTFFGAYELTIEMILRANPRCRVNLWTPLQRDKDGYDTVVANEAGHRLKDYVDAIKLLGVSYGLPVLDLYSQSGFNKLTLDTLTFDRLHPNEEGYQRIAMVAANFLDKL